MALVFSYGANDLRSSALVCWEKYNFCGFLTEKFMLEETRTWSFPSQAIFERFQL